MKYYAIFMNMDMIVVDVCSFDTFEAQQECMNAFIEGASDHNGAVNVQAFNDVY